jgi:hypothetical protein
VGDGFFPDNTAIDHDGRDTSFTGRRPIDTGYSLWIDRDGSVRRIATSGDPTPDGTGHFDFSPALVTTSVDAGHVAFTAVFDAADNLAVFTDAGGPLTRLVGFGDRLFDKKVTNVQISQDALSGNAIAFAATFSDNTSGIYLATLPEPAVPAIAALVLSVTLLARPRKQK